MQVHKVGLLCRCSKHFNKQQPKGGFEVLGITHFNVAGRHHVFIIPLFDDALQSTLTRIPP